jgi:DNA polymerase III epsilon subunit family exonuclease
MLRRISLPALFVIAAIVTMVLAAGAVWQFAKPVDEMLRALVPTWVGIACVFWVLWRRLPPAADEEAAVKSSSNGQASAYGPLRLDARYSDISRLPLAALDYVAVDTETTGPDSARDGVVQIGAVRISGGKIVEDDTFARLVNPGRAIPAAASRFHGITDDRVTDAPGIETVLAEFLDYAGDAVLVGHDLAVDLSFMNRIERIENPALDTMLLSIGAFDSRRDHTLEALAGHFDEPVRDRHNAAADADLTARIFLRLLPELDRAGARRFGDAQDLCAHAADRIRDLGL